MNNRFKFRVWDKRECRYIEAPSPTPLLQADGLLAYFTDHPEYMENYDVQFCTGRKDQNGVLIYEGDIVERDNTDGIKRGVVEFSDNFCEFRATNMSKFSLFERAVVIGNIYENKELLETFTKYGYLKNYRSASDGILSEEQPND